MCAWRYLGGRGLFGANYLELELISHPTQHWMSFDRA